MNKLLTIFLLLLCLSFDSQAETDYKDFIVTDKFIWALTSDGGIKLFDKKGKQVKKRIHNSSKILLLTKDKLGNPVIVDNANEIKRYNELNDSWVVISKYKDNCYGVVFDSKNSCYLITDKGIRDLQTGKINFSANSLNDQITYKDKWGKPYCYFIDKSDRIWLGFGYGEWGGNLFVFKTNSKEFQTPELGSFQINLWPIKSFFEDSSSVYLSAGLQHMMTSGIIVKFDNLKASVLLESRSGWSKEVAKDSSRTMLDGEYIGPSTYNGFLNSIYFYSQNGIFKGVKVDDLSKIDNWKIILKPKLNWKGGQPDAVGSPMNVLKIAAMENDKLIFLSQNDGIGYYDGDHLIMLR
jgi:hypothetical protein